jgi:probable F420-dependent oxidoreductase
MIGEGPMKLGLALTTLEGALHGRTPTFRDLQEMVQRAEQVGFDSCWMGDHLLYRFSGEEERGLWEVFSMLSALAAVTERIALGTLVACTSFRAPALLAKIAATLDEISGGRFLLGLGAGWHQPEYDAFGYPFDHLASRFEEALQVIVPLLRQGQVDFQGHYYQVRNCVLRPRGPSPLGPPIWIGAGGPRLLRVAARYADAWNTAWHSDTIAVKERYEQLKEACAAVGRDPTSIALTVGIRVRLLSAGEETRAAQALSGSAEDIAGRLQSFAEGGVTHLIVALEPKGLAGIEQFARIIGLLHQERKENV